MRYRSDRKFTDYVHRNIANEFIYKRLKWNIIDNKSKQAIEDDIYEGIDYKAVDNLGLKISIQERFRHSSYSNFNDFTIRYSRENSNFIAEKNSEYFKIDADYFVYGITNKITKHDFNEITEFKKFIVIDLNYLKKLLRIGLIRIPNERVINDNIVQIDNQYIYYTGRNINKDGSSEFITINPEKLARIIGNEIYNLVVLQKGFLDNYNVYRNNVIAEEFDNYYYNK